MSDFKTSTLPEHGFPAGLTDMTSQDDQLGWSKQFISNWMGNEIAGNEQGPHGIQRTSLPQFFDGTVTAFDTTQDPKVVTWTAFPNRVTKFLASTTPLRWQIAERSRIYQDEYLEWSVLRDGQDALDFSSNIISCSFTCEGPEYWQYLATQHPEAVLPLYQKLNPAAANSMSNSDLFLAPGVYNPTNYWNFTSSSGCIAHLIHPSNTLSAEIDIAAQATVIRKDSQGNKITDYTKLIQCSQYGNQFRNSDPTIGGNINDIARDGYNVTVAEAVALYINTFVTSSFQLDYSGNKDGSDLRAVPAGVFNFTRGDISTGKALRLDISIPPNTLGTATKTQLTVSDIYDSTGAGSYVYCAAQFTDYIKMSVSAYKSSQGTASDPVACPGEDKKHGAMHLMAAEVAPGVKVPTHPKFAGRR